MSKEKDNQMLTWNDDIYIINMILIYASYWYIANLWSSPIWPEHCFEQSSVDLFEPASAGSCEFIFTQIHLHDMDQLSAPSHPKLLSLLLVQRLPGCPAVQAAAAAAAAAAPGLPTGGPCCQRTEGPAPTASGVGPQALMPPELHRWTQSSKSPTESSRSLNRNLYKVRKINSVRVLLKISMWQFATIILNNVAQEKCCQHSWSLTLWYSILPIMNYLSYGLFLLRCAVADLLDYMYSFVAWSHILLL